MYTQDRFRNNVIEEFTNLFGVPPHINSQKDDLTNLVNWRDACAFARFTFGGEEADGENEFTTFLEQITGNYGRPDPVENILAEYWGLTDEIINTILEAIDNA